MIIYYLLLIFIFILGNVFLPKNKKMFITTILLLFIVIAGFRSYEIGCDTPSYRNVFNGIANSGLLIYKDSWLEIGYLFLNYVISRVYTNFTFFLVIVACLTNYFICNFFKKYSQNLCMTFVLFILCRCFFDEMNVMRQYLSIAIILMGFKFIEERKLIKYLVVVLCASLIHSSSFFLIILYFIYNMNLSTKSHYIMWGISIIIYFSLLMIISKITSFLGIYNNYISVYFGSNKIASILSFAIAFVAYIFSMFMYKYNKDKMKYEDNEDNKDIKFNRFLLNCQLIQTILYMLSIRMSILNRFVIIFDLFSIISISNYTNFISNNKTRKIVKALIYISYFIVFSVIMRYRPEWYNVTPYSFI